VSVPFWIALPAWIVLVVLAVTYWTAYAIVWLAVQLVRRAQGKATRRL
jgi:hypothetical protein